MGLATSSSVVMRYCTALVTLPATEPPLSLMSLTKSARFIDSVPEMQNATPAKMAPPFLAAGAASSSSSSSSSSSASSASSSSSSSTSFLDFLAGAFFFLGAAFGCFSTGVAISVSMSLRSAALRALEFSISPSEVMRLVSGRARDSVAKMHLGW